MPENKQVFRFFGYCCRCYVACVILAAQLPERQMFKCSQCRKKKQARLTDLTHAIKNLKI